ncbi:trimeric intracellular cation channel family protein [Rhodococcus sp. X156]|uniref:trimeric intracellular cation channel family protein n=1 Tax=Rhodococcus sp. X156 TaxID=2499145 RepID=UPI000FDA8EAD|nr:trimeric intracellular cation channel family protein [Rhodococcus sp. X156]
MLLVVLDLIGITAFAASGALAGVRARLDVFGIVVLGATTALGGGVLRDVLLGINPPTSLVDWRYLVTPVVVSLLVFRFHPRVSRLRRSVLILDALGMGLFSTYGAATALSHDAGVVAACVIGMTTAIGGGALRDVLLNEVPIVLRREIYAVAALAGATVLVAADAAGVPQGLAALLGSVLATGLRLLAMWRHWNAPVPR